MCKACVDLVREICPEVPDERYGEFLIGATCYPMGGPEHIEPQLREIAKLFAAGELGESIVDGACCWADHQMEADMQLAWLQEEDWS